MLNVGSNKKEFQKLIVSLSHRKNPGVYLLTCDNDKTQDLVLQLVRSDFPNFLHVTLDLHSHQVYSLRNAFDTILPKEVRNSRPLQYMVHITGLSTSLFSSTEKGFQQTKLVAEMNFERERLFHDYPFITLIWENSYFLRSLFFQAGDLMSWLVERYEFEPEFEVTPELLTQLEKPIPSQGVHPERLSRIEELRELLLLMDKGGDNQEKALLERLNTLKQLGKEYQKAFLYQQAIETFQQALDLAEKAHLDISQRSSLYYNLAENCYWSRKFREALECITKGEIMLEKLPNDVLNGHFLHLKGMVYQEQRNWAESLANYLKALDWYEKTGNEYELGDTYHQIGRVYEAQRNWAESLANYQKALDRKEKTGNEYALGNTYHQIGNVYAEQQNWAESLANYQKALDWYEKTGNEYALGNTYHQIGRVYEEQRNWSESLANYQKALDWYEKTGNEYELGGTYHQIGRVYEEQRNWAESLSNYMIALDWYEMTGNEYALGGTYHQIGMVYQEQRIWAQSLANFQKALVCYEKTGNEHALGSTYHQIGRIYEEKRNWAESLANYQKALDWYEKTGIEYALGDTYHQIGRVYEEQLNLAESLANYQKALDWYEKTGNGYAMGSTFHQIGMVYEEQERLTDAFKWYKLANTNLERFNHPGFPIGQASLDRIERKMAEMNKS